MLVLGLSGFPATCEREVVPDLPRAFYHDAAACLVGEAGVLAAVEEERVNRSKHTNLFPAGAVRACLEQSGASPNDIDQVAYFFAEDFTDAELGLEYVRHPQLALRTIRELLADRVGEQLGSRFAPQRISFARHHEAHAAAAFHQSGLGEALVLVMDGNGENESVSVLKGAKAGLERLRTYPRADSLGHFYTRATQFLGYDLFDEYKVMGLAPYGDPATYRDAFGSLFKLLPEGGYALNADGLQPALLALACRPRRAGERFTQAHKDLAAAVQETLERVVLHIVEFWRQKSGLRALCLAGGVAHNSTLNGRILASGWFDELFVHPASHDAGAALGAAILSLPKASRGRRAPWSHRLALRDVYWGPDIGTAASVGEELARWHAFLEWEERDDISACVARLLADGAVVGWARGRSEFGPRALGNRSILADPRPAENQDRVNRLVKKRESFRPFAPAVLAEVAHEYFEIPPTGCPLDYMSCVVRVRTDKRRLLGAVTHIDGTARIQTVTRETNEPFWRLISRFGDLTGVPVLLNTSFNNHAEPIVQSAREAIACFLTTRLDYLVLGDLLAWRKPVLWSSYLQLAPRLAPTAELAAVATSGPDGQTRLQRHIHPRQRRAARSVVSDGVHELLQRADGRTPLGDLLPPTALTQRLVEELLSLWDRRLVTLQP